MFNAFIQKINVILSVFCKMLKKTYILLFLITLICVQSLYGSEPSNSGNIRSVARMYISNGDFQKAHTLAEQALRIAKYNASENEIANCLLDLAYLCNEEGKFPAALKYAQQAIDIQKKTLAGTHPYIAYSLRTLSSIYFNQQKLELAQTTLTSAISIMLKNHAAEDRTLSQFYIDMGKILTAQSKYSDADFYFSTAGKIINAAYGPEHLYAAIADSEIAKLRLLENNIPLAEQLITSSILIQQKTYGSSNPMLASSQLTLAKICLIKADFSKAKELAASCLETIKQNCSSSHPLIKEANEILLATNVIAKK